jgi:DNA-directed RNA polymerase subunit RPC12/RpoP
MIMVMVHNGWEKRCPFCFSRKLFVKDYDMADPKYYESRGRYWFLYKCKKCGGECQDINNMESKREVLDKLAARQRLREGSQNEEVSVT